MTRTLLFLLSVGALLGCRAAVLPVHEEPLHRLVHEGAEFQVLDVGIPSGVVSRFHLHDAPIAYVSIDPSPMDLQELGGEWRGTQPTDPAPWERGEVAWTLDYAETPLVHRVTAVGPEAFRCIAVVNRGSGSDGDLVSAVPGRLEQVCSWFAVSRATLAPGEIVDWQGAARPAVAVLVSEGEAQLEHLAEAEAASGPGAFLVRDEGVPCRLRNSGETAVEVVFVELR